MTELTLIVTDFVGAAVGADRERAAALPRLPALELLLARARAEALPAGWRAWLARRVAAPSRSALASVAAAAFRERLEPTPAAVVQAHFWLATPLHLFAGIDSVHLHPAGLLQLSESEQRSLAQDFARVFSDARWSLSAIGQRELLLAGPPLYASAADPAELLSSAPDACMARGPDAGALRRLASEIELWLHEHPINLERSRRGELPVSALWLWGGALDAEAAYPPAPPAAAAAGRLARLYGRDSYAEALWRLRGEAALPLPASFAAESALAQPQHDSSVLLPLRSECGLVPAWLELERLWLSGAVDAVRRRRVATLHCLLGARAYRLTWRHCIRVWRSRAPWWEELS